jgi:large subunit ribosomal protein L23
MKKTAQDIIIRPLITEKSTDLREKANQIVFEVAKNAGKLEIKKAVETLFKVKVIDVHTISVKGKKRRVGKHIGVKSDWKKAVVKLKEGDTISIFEGV